MSGISGQPRGRFDVMVAAGLLSGWAALNKFGRNTNIAASTPEDIWDVGGDWVAPTAARIHNLTSTDGNDTAAGAGGTGARTVTVVGLDGDWNEVTETVSLAGASNAPTTTAYRRIYRMYVATAGSGAINAGNILATAVTDATVTAQITAGAGQTLMAIYTVPAGRQPLLDCYYASMLRQGGAGAADITLLIRDGSATSGPWLTKHVLGINTTGQNPFQHCFTPPLPVAAKHDIRLRANPSVNNSDIPAGFDGYLRTV